MSNTWDINGSLVLGNDAKLTISSSKGDYLLVVQGDTIKIATKRTIKDGERGEPGEICWDEDFLYICIAQDKWSKIKHIV